MKLYDYYRSTACYRVRIALNLKQIRHEKIPISLISKDGEQSQLEYLTINPQGLVPSLDENGHIITQSLAIIEYLDELFPEPPLLPKTPLARAQVRGLALSIACDIHPLNNLRVLNRLRSEFSASDEQVENWYFNWLKIGLDAFENQLKTFSNKGPFCYGNEVTIADLCLIPQVYNAYRFNFSMENYPLINAINTHCLTLTPFKQATPYLE